MHLFKNFNKMKGGTNTQSGLPKWVLIVIIIALLLAIIGFILGIISASKTGQISTNKNNIELNHKDLEIIRNDIDQKFGSMFTELGGQKIGPQGGMGPIGPQGPPGGLFSAFGQLIQTKEQKSANILAGKGEMALVYLDKKGYAPNQYWFLENKDGGAAPTIIKNKFSGYCLEGNPNNNSVYSNSCDNTKSNQRFEWNQFGQLRLGGTQKCMTTKAFQLKNYSNQRIQDTQNVSNTNAGTVDILSLEGCSNFYDPKQAWYFGS